jgi:hypothetical protein
MGFGVANKIYVSFHKSFWGKRQGWLNFVPKGEKENPYPLAYIYPKVDKPILCFFVSSTPSLKQGKLSEE